MSIYSDTFPNNDAGRATKIHVEQVLYFMRNFEPKAFSDYHVP